MQVSSARGSDGGVARKEIANLGGVDGQAGVVEVHCPQQLVAGLLVELNRPRRDQGAGRVNPHARCNVTQRLSGAAKGSRKGLLSDVPAQLLLDTPGRQAGNTTEPRQEAFQVQCIAAQQALQADLSHAHL